ncbi:hypothetical protein KM043_018476 [Ampulex compressa]|nr:hypothetical protein KM043_018476 [Ampulex compressa]
MKTISSLLYKCKFQSIGRSTERRTTLLTFEWPCAVTKDRSGANDAFDDDPDVAPPFMERIRNRAWRSSLDGPRSDLPRMGRRRSSSQGLIASRRAAAAYSAGILAISRRQWWKADCLEFRRTTLTGYSRGRTEIIRGTSYSSILSPDLSSLEDYRYCALGHLCGN